LVCSILLSRLFLPAVNSWSGKNVTFGLAVEVTRWVGMIAIVALTGIVSGGGIALVLSGTRPTAAISNRLSGTIDYPFIKRMLITAQFTMSVTLIISTIVVYGQLRYMSVQPVGFDQSNVIVIPLNLGFIYDHNPNNQQVTGLRSSKPFENELLRLPYFTEVSKADHVPGLPPGRGRLWDAMVSGVNEERVLGSTFMRVLQSEHDFFQTLGMRLVFGSYPDPVDLTNYNVFGVRKVFLNETAVRHLGWSMSPSVLDRSIDMYLSNVTVPGRVVGVVEDTHFRSLFHPMEPMLFIPEIGGEHMIVRMNPGNADRATEELARIWQTHYPDMPLLYSFLDQNIEQLYEPLARLGNVLLLCAFLAAILTILGLINMLSLAIQQRTNEFGISSILGATMPLVERLLSKEFVIMAMPS